MKTLIASVYSCHSPPPTVSTWIFTYAIVSLFIVAPEITYSIPETDIWSYLLPISCLFNVNFTSYQCQSIIYQRLGIVRPKLSNFDSCATCPPHVHPSSNTRPTLGLPQTPVKPYYSPIPSFKSQCFWKLEIMKLRITGRFGLENFCFHTSQNNTKYANVNPQ